MTERRLTVSREIDERSVTTTTGGVCCGIPRGAFMGRWAFGDPYRLAATTMVVVALAIVAATWGARWDFTYDWVIGRVVFAGGDPYAPLSEMAEFIGLSTAVDAPHPRTPGAIFLTLPVALMPWGWVLTVGRLGAVAAVAWLGSELARMRGVRPAYVLIFLPLLIAIWPFSGAVTTGNTGILVAALLAWGVRTDRGWPIGVATVMKVWPWVFVLALLISRPGRRLGKEALKTSALLTATGLLIPAVSVSGTIAVLTAGAVDSGERSLAILGLDPSWIIAIGVLVAAAITYARVDATWAIVAGLALSPVVWPSYLPAVLIPFAYRPGGRTRIQERHRTPPPPVATGDAFNAPRPPA